MMMIEEEKGKQMTREEQAWEVAQQLRRTAHQHRQIVRRIPVAQMDPATRDQHDSWCNAVREAARCIERKYCPAMALKLAQKSKKRVYAGDK